MLPSQPNESLIDGIECLHALAVSQAPVGVRELARRLGMEPTRVNRLLKTLAHMGIAAQTPAKKYVPGPGMHVLAAHSIFASGLLRRAIPRLEGLGRHGMVAALGVLWKDHVSYLYHASPGMRTADALGRMALYPATLSSIGMILLANLPEKDVAKLYQGKEIPGFEGGIGDLLTALRKFRKDGCATVITGENEAGNRSVACAVGSPPIAAVALSGRISEAEAAHFRKILREAAEEIGGTE